MSRFDHTADDLSPRRSSRPVGLSPGAGALVGAWIVAAAIARLTGAAAVILLLAAGIVGAAFAAVSAWRSVRVFDVERFDATDVATVDTPVDATIGTHGRDGMLRRTTPRLLIEPMTASIDDRTRPDGPALATSNSRGRNPGFSAGGHTGRTVIEPADLLAAARPTGDGGEDCRVAIRFTRPGIVTAVRITIQSSGSAGLVWWQRAVTVPVTPIHIATVPAGPLLPVGSSIARRDGSASSRRGQHSGEIDGVRVWREGDDVAGVHWPSTLRAGHLIVHDRTAAAEQAWTVDMPTGDTNAELASRLRRTLDEGLHRGHDVSVRDATTDETTAVTSERDAARWSAIAASRERADDGEMRRRGSSRVSLLRRPIHLRTRLETVTIVPSAARWSAAAAALLSIAMLLGALSKPPSTFVLAAAGLCLGALVSLAVARRHGEQPPALRIVVALAALGALAFVAVDAHGVDGLLAALRGPMPDLLIVLVVFHGFEVTDRRTLRVHQAITFAVAAYAAGLRIDGALGWWVAAWGSAFVLSVLTTNPRLPRRVPNPDQVARRRRRTMTRAVVRTLTGATATLALLSVIPIPDGPARLGLPALSDGGRPVDTPGALAGADGSAGSTDTPQDRAGDSRDGSVVGYPGFTRTLDTSVRGDLGDQVVMRVRSPEPAFWRGQTFSDFDGRTWTVSSDPGRPDSGPTIDVPLTVGDARGLGVDSEQLIQTYFVETDLPNIVFAAYRPEQLTFDGTVWTRPDGALRSDVTLTAGSVYTVVSNRLQVTPEVLRAQGDVGALFDDFRRVEQEASTGSNAVDPVAPFLTLPESTTPRTIALADRLHTPGASTYDTILAYERWLSANTEYDLDAPVPSAGTDAVDDFLFDSRRGFCEQIASTLTIMLRSQGVPARLATGYVAGERDRVSGVWKVRASDAHAWVEVWFPLTGWQAFDPTADVPLAGDATAGTVGGDLFAAAVSSVASHGVELGALAVVALCGWGLIRLVLVAGHRRRRGRWGVLQDRFRELDRPGRPEQPGESYDGAARTNAAIARHLDPSSTTEPAPEPEPGSDLAMDPSFVAADVAAELDRVAFDPDWVDDDSAFERTRRGVAVLERRVGRSRSG